MQQSQARHHQPAFRIRDGVEGPSHVLDSASGALDDLPDVNFRIDREAGRVLWDWEGETWTKHFYPPNLRNLEFTPESLIGEMDYAGVQRVLLHTNPMLGRDNGYQAQCVRRYPGRILSMAGLDEHRIHSDPEEAIAGITEAIRGLGLDAIKFGSYGYDLSPEPWDGGPYEPFWDAVSALGAPVFFTLGTGPGRALEIAPDAEQQQGVSRRAEHPGAADGEIPLPGVQHHPRIPLARFPRPRRHLASGQNLGGVRQPPASASRSASRSASGICATTRTARSGRRSRRWSSASVPSG